MQQGLRSGFELSESRLDTVRLRQDLFQANATTLASIEGHVGPEYEGKAIELMDCEAYERLAQEEGARLIQETLSRYAVDDAMLVQRTGRLVVGEAFYWIGVAGTDEIAAQNAMQYLLEQMKVRLPLWCKAHFKDGHSAWCNLPAESELKKPDNQVQEPVQAEHQAEESATEPASPAAVPPAEAPEASFVETGFYKMDVVKESKPQEPVLTPALYYQKQMQTPEIGGAGRQKLARSRVLVVGAGSIGSAALAYLAGAGVGLLGVCDAERLEARHLCGQSLYSVGDIGKNKAILAVERFSAINPFIQGQAHPKKLERYNAQGLMTSHDLILDCTNDVKTRLLLNEAAVSFRKPLIQVGLFGSEGQMHLYKPTIGGCLRCQWSALNDTEASTTWGIGVFGALQAMEAIKVLVGLPTALERHALQLNLMTYETRLVERSINPYCPVCQAYARGLSDLAPSELPVDTEAADPDWMVFMDSRNEAQLSSYVLVDVSETREHVSIPGHPCLNMPFSRFNLENPRLDHKHRYLLYCQKGTRSLHLTRELRRRGYNNVFALAGGIARLQPEKETPAVSLPRVVSAKTSITGTSAS